MEEVPIEERITKKSVYLPHHPVIREDKETTQTRVVYDASCKGTNGVSLNDELLLGPVLQNDLRSLIMRWRMHAVCFIADIQKMYRMVLLAKEDTDFQRTLWRDKTGEIKDFRLLTVTFGTASAPYLAVRTLMQLAQDEGKNYPAAAKIILEDFYVDDVMSGSDTVEQAIQASHQLRDILHRGGFELKKWSSNNVDFMKSIEPNDRSSHAHIDINMDGTVKALGILWNLGTDEFQYNLNLPTISTYITKRSILSDIQKLFDPLGWIAPSIIHAKILIQKLWIEKISWDEEINSMLKKEWLNIRSDFANVNDIHIDRWLNTMNFDKRDIQLHGFSDASMHAYAAVVYIRVRRQNSNTVSKLIAARTRVAPLKTISLPRLELYGAVLLSKLIKQTEKAMKILPSQIFAWTDSTIVLSWLLGEPGRWKTFVANRVVEIIGNVKEDRWHHVESHDNPADIASRGMLLSDLKKCELWWKGPEWLIQDKIQFRRSNIITTDLEAKKVIQANFKIEEKEKSLSEQFKDFDTLTQLTKAIAYIRRFLNFRKQRVTNTNFTPEELEKSLHICIKLVQKNEYEEEINMLKRNKQIKKRSNLKSLNPFLDENNILRVGGRLRNANICEQAKHPIILGNKTTLTPLIVADAHQKTLHGGVQLMLCYLRSKYWIIRCKGLVKRHIHKCLICAKQNATAKTQVMGDLPRQRVNPSRPFSHSGVDFAGPFKILTWKGRGAKTSKAYIAIFVCMATKAIHLELVGDLTTEAFIGAFRRFVARRGKCAHLWSDQGRNFVGANKELIDAWREANLEFTGSIAETLASDGTQWHFIPAYSPNFGGLWEAGVKSIKHHLKRILTTNLTFEEMTTVLCQIEACLNSRPLSPIDDTDIDNLNPLTPGHFLIGEAPLVIPTPISQEVKECKLSRWQYTQKLLRDFWQRWQQEYLSRLQQRPKWLKREKEFNIKDIVLIKQENLPPGKWALGRIVDKHPGPDGITRVYSVKSGDSIVKRSISKLCSLPIETN